MKTTAKQFISIFVSSIILMGNVYSNEVKICPSRAADAIKYIDEQLENKYWINIELKKCKNIQTEIIMSAIKTINADNLFKYIPLMDRNTLKLVRNSYFAKKGYIFKDEKLFENFSKFEWYRPSISNPALIELTEHEKEQTKLLKGIEDNWVSKCDANHEGLCIKKQNKLPSGITMKEGSLVFSNNKSIDVSTQEQPIPSRKGAKLYTTYKYNGVKAWNSIVVCKYTHSDGFGVDDRSIREVSLYSDEAKIHGTYKINTNKATRMIRHCPENYAIHPDTLISYGDVGCCGNTETIFVSFNKTLTPITILSGNIKIFTSNHDDVFYYFDTDYKRTKSTNYRTSTYKYSLGIIEANGGAKLLSSKTNSYNHFNNKINKRGAYEIKDVFPNEKNYNDGEIATAIKLENRLLIYWLDYNGGPDGITIIPL